MTLDPGPSPTQPPAAPASAPVVAPASAPVEVTPLTGTAALVGEMAFAGFRVARALVKRGLAVRVLCPDTTAEQALSGTNAEVVRGALDSAEALAKLLRGADYAGFVSPITMCGRAHRPWQHPQDVRQFLDAAQAAGVRKVAYHSALGAHPKAASCALRDAAAAEELVRAVAGAEHEGSSPLFKYYLARTGPLMGPGDGFLSEIVGKAQGGCPFATVLGYGSTQVQPLHVDDFAQCFARFFLDQPEELESGRYSLAGPETRTLLELLDMVLARLGRKKLKLHAPLFVLGLLAAVRPGRPPSSSTGAPAGLTATEGGATVAPLGLKERVSLLFDAFATDRNDSPRLLGPGETLLTLRQAQEEILAAAAS